MTSRSEVGDLIGAGLGSIMRLWIALVPRAIQSRGAIAACVLIASCATRASDRPQPVTPEIERRPATAPRNEPRDPGPSARDGEAGSGDRAPSSVDGTIARDELNPVLEAGLGRFLQGVRTAPYMRNGEFVGFRIRRLWPNDERFASVDLQPGDVVVRINGQSIERPGQAKRVWDSLREADELVVEYLRGDTKRRLRYRIVD